MSFHWINDSRTRGFELKTRVFKLATRGFELVTRKAEPVLLSFKLVTRVLPYHYRDNIALALFLTSSRQILCLPYHTILGIFILKLLAPFYRKQFWGLNVLFYQIWMILITYKRNSLHSKVIAWFLFAYVPLMSSSLRIKIIVCKESVHNSLCKWPDLRIFFTLRIKWSLWMWTQLNPFSAWCLVKGYCRFMTFMWIKVVKGSTKSWP